MQPRASPPSSCCRSTHFVDDRHLVDKGLTNYWGYNTIGFFAPDPRYTAPIGPQRAEFKAMVQRCTPPASR